MQHHHKVYKGRAHTKKQAVAGKAKLSSFEKKKRIAKKKFISIFPNWKFLKQHESLFTIKKRAV